MAEFKVGDRVVLPPTMREGVVTGVHHEMFPAFREPQQVIVVQYPNGDTTTMRAAHWLAAIEGNTP
jgi:hypothetical protein